MSKYDEIINLPHHQSLNHKHMSNADRAAQFAPFAALTGYDTLIKEMARSTKKKITISNEKAEELSSKLAFLKEHLKEKIEVAIIYFKKDNKKEGGAYLEITGFIKTIDEYNKRININGQNIAISDIYDISSSVFDEHLFDD